MDFLLHPRPPTSFFYYFLEVARLMMSIEAEKVSLFIFFRLLIDTTQSS